MKDIKQNSLPMMVAVAIIVGALGFFGGMKYQQSKLPRGGQFLQRMGEAREAGFGGNRPVQGRGGMMNGNNRPVSGDIISADEKSITVKMPDGGSKIVLISDTTAINKASAGAKTDLTTGQTVMVFGSENADGSVTATNIQLNPAFNGRWGNNPSASPKP